MTARELEQTKSAADLTEKRRLGDWQCFRRMICHTAAVLSIRLDPKTERRLGELARRTGRTKSYHARELIESNIEDLEDRYLAEARLEKRRPPLTSRHVRKQLSRGR